MIMTASVFASREPVVLAMARALDRRIHRVWVPGEPQPAPKKDVAKITDRDGKERLVPIDHDYRTKQDPSGAIDPKTGKVRIIKYDRGYKGRWVKHVTSTVQLYMIRNRLDPYPQSHPIAMGSLFFVPQAKGNGKIFPSQPPDQDNFEYAVRNALKRTPAKKRGMESTNPTGVLYYEDDQPVWRLLPDGKLWASEANPPGVLISFCDAFLMRDEIMHWQDPIETRMEI